MMMPHPRSAPLRLLAALAPIILLSCPIIKFVRGFPVVVRHDSSHSSSSFVRIRRPCLLHVSSSSSRPLASLSAHGDGGGSEEGTKEDTDPSSVLQQKRQRRKNKLEVGTTLAVPSASEGHESTITYLGCGSGAVVRLGCVLVAPEHETRHFLRRAAIFVYAMGERPAADEDGGEYVIRGLILDQPTAFALSEMMPGIDPSSNGMAHLPIFRGGDTGQDGLILLQGRHDESGDEVGDGDGDAIETTTMTATRISRGLCHGGWNEALAVASKDGALDNASRKFKVFFNYCEFTEAQLEAMLASSTGTDTSDSAAAADDDDDDDDAWVSLEVPPDAVLSSEYGPGEAWANFRNAVTQMRQAAMG